MAREYAQIKLSINADDDWRTLSADARYLYLTLLISPTLTHCGTADWRPARLAAVNGQSRATVEAAGAELVASLHLVIDEETEEVLIRSFVRNDGLMKQPKMAVAMANAHAGVASVTLRGVIVHEAKRLKADFPNLHGWGAERAVGLLSMNAIDPSTYPLGKGSVKGKSTPIENGSVKGSPTPAPTPAPTTSSLSPGAEVATTPRKRVAESATEHPRFAEFYDAYPRKVSRPAAVKAFKSAVKKIDPDLLIASTRDYAEWALSEIEGGWTEIKYIPHASTWLNGERWADERPVRQAPRTKLDGFRDTHAALLEQFGQPEPPGPQRQIGGGQR